jgi:hypothetical protein
MGRSRTPSLVRSLRPAFSSMVGWASSPIQNRPRAASRGCRAPFNTLIAHTFDSGWGGHAHVLVTSSINHNFAGTLVIPLQLQIDAGIADNTKVWGARLNVGNVANAKNWAPPNAVYGNAAILPLPGT